MTSILLQAFRSWKSAGAVAVLAALALGIGIGSTTAIYTVVRSVMLKPLPYPHAERLVALYAATFSQPTLRGSSGFPDLIEYQRRTHSFEMFGWFTYKGFTLTSPGQPQHLTGVAVTPSLAHGLGVTPLIGRWFSNDTEAVISHALWQRLGASRGLLGQPVTIDGRLYTISGVMPAWFHLPLPGPGTDQVATDVWMALDPNGRGEDPHEGMLFCYARLKPGVDLAQATEDVKAVAAVIARDNPSDHPSYTARLDGLGEAAVLEIRPTLLMLFAASALLLLITCANVSGLLVARSVARARETALRIALGAAHRQLALLYFVEGLLVSLAGATLGVLFSIGLVRLMVSAGGDFIPRADEIGIDWTVFFFALGAALIASLIASLAPLWQAGRTEAHEVLSDGVRTSAGVRSRRLSQSLVVGEIALAFTLLAISGILISHWIQLTHIHPGFDPDRLLTFQMNLPAQIVSNSGRRAAYQDRLTSALEAIPGVSGVATVNQLPLSGCCFGTTIYPEGHANDPRGVQRTSFMLVTPDYWRTMRIPLQSGRFLTDRDTNENLLTVVINHAAAAQYWPNQSPVGAYGHAGSPTGSRFQVVGVVGDVRNEGLGRPTVPEIYLSSRVAVSNPLDFVVRSGEKPESLIASVRRAVQKADPAQAIYSVATMNQIAHQSLSLERTGSFLVTFFAIAALVMAALGIYGVVSYSVRQRTVEIGTRMALGAIGRDVLSLVLGGGIRMAAFGVLLGGVAAAAAGWALVRSFEIHDLGALPFVSSTAVVAAIAMAASFFPAWRATLLSPMVAIRNQPEAMWESARQSVWQVFRGISDIVSPGQAEPDSKQRLLTEFADAARRAESFREAFQIALDTLCGQVGAESALLLENVSDEELGRTAASPREQFQEASLPRGGLLLNRLKSYHAPLPLSAADLDVWLRWASESKPQYVPELEVLRNADVRLATPLRARNEIVGVLLLGPPSGRDHYTESEQRLIGNCADQLSLMIENSRLTDRVVEQEKLRRDLALAAEVQKRLLPAAPPETDTTQFAAFSLPARTIGGDYYDFLDLGGRRIGIALGDIAGKGVAAALLMSAVQSSLRAFTGENDVSLPQLAARLNRLLHRSTGSHSYATFFYAQLDQSNLQLRYVNAGHNPPYLIRVEHVGADSTTEIHELATGGTVLGLFPQANFEEGSVNLVPGDVLIAFTDGVIDALNEKDEDFGEERLKKLLLDAAHLPAEKISKRLSAALENWIQDTEQFDDLTFVVMKVGTPMA